MNETICALATPIGTGGISIIRISGEKSLEIAKQFFSCSSIDYENIKPRYLYFGNFNGKDFIDQVLFVYFKAPFSFTGEDVVEFQFHGGEYLASKILKELLTKCRLSEPGEFTKRAFLNGKISLDEAQAVSDLIFAESDAEIKSANLLQKGFLNKKIKSVQEDILNLLAEIEANLDYPDDFSENVLIEKSKTLAKNIKEKIEEILTNSENSKQIKNGINVAIVGKTNVGKSSLLNAILGENRAIVTDIEGTTRDVISERVLIDGYKVNFIDTAGIRESEDVVEKIGIKKSLEEIDNADLVLFVLDLSREIEKDEFEVYEKIKNKPHIVVANKCDNKKININFEKFIEISAKNDINIEKLKKEIIKTIISEKIDYSKIMLTNERQISILKNCLNLICEFLNKTLSLDLIAFEIKNIWKELGKITGDTEDEKIIDTIFSKFCLGK